MLTSRPSLSEESMQEDVVSENESERIASNPTKRIKISKGLNSQQKQEKKRIKLIMLKRLIKNIEKALFAKFELL